MQTRLGSLIEASANTALGWSINFVANLIVLPRFGFNVTPLDAAGIGTTRSRIGAGFQRVWRIGGVSGRISAGLAHEVAVRAAAFKSFLPYAGEPSGLIAGR